MDEQKRLLKNTGIIALGNLSTKLVSFFLLPLYTAVLSTAEYGTVDYIISISTFCVPFISALMDESIFRFLIDCKTEKDKSSVISTAMTIVCIGMVLFVSITLPLLLFLKYQYSIYLILYVLSSAVCAMMNALLRGIGRTDKYAVFNFIIGILTIVLNILFVAAIRWGVKGMLLSTILSHTLIPIIYIVHMRLWKYIDMKSVKWKNAKEMLVYSIPLIPNKISWSIINLSDRILIMNTIGSDMTGVFAVTHKFPNLMDTIYGFFYQSWKESSARAFNDGNPDTFYNQIYKYLKSFMYSVVLGMTAFMPLLFHFLVNEKFYSAIPYVPVLLLATYFANVSGFYGGVFTAYKDTKIMGATTVVSALINLGLSLSLIWKIELWAPTIAALVANFSVYMYRRLKVKKYVKLEENTSRCVWSWIVTAVVFALFYTDSTIWQAFGCIVAIVYAVIENRELIRVLLGVIKKRKNSVSGAVKQRTKKIQEAAPAEHDEKETCCGCGICAVICPHQAIHMTEDDCGFVYPVIDREKCSNCGVCDRICAYRSAKESTWTPRKTCVAVTKNTKVEKSASGGVFASLAANILKEGGIVYGCSMERINGRLTPVHIGIEDVNELYRLSGSKYVQSSITGICKDVKKQVLSGRAVLFSGTPCQVAAIRSLLGGRSYDNLLLVDIICHGVPSAHFFGDYINDLECRCKGQVTQFTFRDKEYGWNRTGSYEISKNGKTQKHVLPFEQSSYYAYFMGSDIFRENCYSCKYAGKERVGDITVGDYWGIQAEHPELLTGTGGQIERRKGVSCLLVNTDIGEQWLGKFGGDMTVFPSEFEKAAKENTQLRIPSTRGSKRDKIFAAYRTGGYLAVERQYRKSLGIKWYVMMVKRIIPKGLKDTLRRIKSK